MGTEGCVYTYICRNNIIYIHAYTTIKEGIIIFLAIGKVGGERGRGANNINTIPI